MSNKPSKQSAAVLQKALPIVLYAVLFVNCNAWCQLTSPTPNNWGQKLPPGVPKVVDTNGNVLYVPHKFTSEAYQREALALLVEEANKVATDLHLPEALPITKTNLAEFHISPFGFSFSEKKIGFVATTNYTYYVAQGNKFNQLTIAEYDKTCINLRKKGTLPVAQIDTNSAYQLATQWLSAASIDVAGLNHDYHMHVAVSPFWSGLPHLGQTPKKRFVPIYFVWWNASKGIAEGQGTVASVELFSPGKTLLQLSIEDEKYILRQPVVFTNLVELFPGTSEIHTNHPVPTIYMSAPPP